VVLSVHHGPADRARPELAGALTVCRGEGEGDGAELIKAKIRRCGGEVAPALERIRVQWRCLVWSKQRH
jgi:hypothetical protein